MLAKNLFIIGGVLAIFYAVWHFLEKFLKNSVTSKPKSVDSLESVKNLQDLILNLDPVKDKEKIQFLLTEIAPNLVAPEGYKDLK